MFFFEGSEKKFEFFSENNNLNFLEYPVSFWESLVKHSNAQILSHIETPLLKAFLLSESSLFVWQKRILMITCGTTTLGRAAEFLLNTFKEESLSIEDFIFIRKNEYFSSLQQSSFQEDQTNLKKYLNGSSWQIGTLDLHHQLIFSSQKKLPQEYLAPTLEILSYHPKESLVEQMENPSVHKKDFYRSWEPFSFYKNFTFDDFVFSPTGYSLNGIWQDFYITLHITPQKNFSYISFETNYCSLDILKNFTSAWYHFLYPMSFDLISYNIPEDSLPLVGPEYSVTQQSKGILPSGHNLSFKQFNKINLPPLDLQPIFFEQ